MDRKLGFGCMRLPLTDPKDVKNIDLPQVERMVDTFLERGFTYFDTAYMYHDYESERAMRKALVERHDRAGYTLATKLPLTHLKEEGDMERIFCEQLEKTGAGYFDYYLLHNVNKTTAQTADRLDAWKFIREKKQAGLVKHIGFSFHEMPEMLDDILARHPEIEFVQIQLNYLDWEADNVRSRANYQVCRKYNKPVVVMEPVKGGTLARLPGEGEKLLHSMHPDWSPAGWAVRFAASLPGVFMVLSGMSSLDQVLDNTDYMQDAGPLGGGEKEALRKVVDMIHHAIAIDCTSCHYCTEGCPVSIPIPAYFQLYNAYKQVGGGWVAPQIGQYEKLSAQEEYGKASACLKCGKCENICPQHLKIRAYMEQVAKAFEEN